LLTLSPEKNAAFVEIQQRISLKTFRKGTTSEAAEKLDVLKEHDFLKLF
jgi:hypothetical protein